MKALVTSIALVLFAQASFAFSTPAMTVRLVDKDNQPIAGFPVVLQTQQTDLTKVLTPHSNGQSVNMQRTIVTDKNGVANLSSVFMMFTPKSILVVPSYVEHCPDKESWQTNHRTDFNRTNEKDGFFIATPGEKQGWGCMMGQDQKYNDLQTNLVCKASASADDMIAMLRQNIQQTNNAGCEAQKDF